MFDLFRYTKDGSVAKVKELIESGADVNIKDLDGFSPLHYACETGNNEIAKLLIDANSEVNAQASDDWGNETPLHIACLNGHTETVQLLIDSGADVNKKIRHDLFTPLHYAVRRQRKKIVELLIDAGADVDAKSNSECTALHYAFGEDIAKLLIDAGADVDERDRNFDTPLHFAIEKGYTHMAKLLIESGANLFAYNDKDQLPIALAFKDCNVDLIRFIADQLEKDIKNRKGIKNDR